MAETSERRSKPDRRRAPRGGRRPYDSPGATPLVLVVGPDGAAERESETILGALRFAVAPVGDVAEARRIIETLHPDLIVAPKGAAADLRDGGADVPIVEFDGVDAGDDLVQRIRAALRTRA